MKIRGWPKRSASNATWSAKGKRMRDVYQFIAKVAPTDSTVLIRAKAAQGKETGCERASY
jgi:DNA-binding NtrC family response regulator